MISIRSEQKISENKNINNNNGILGVLENSGLLNTAKILKSYILLLLLATMSLYSISAQGVISQHANDDGIYAQFGPKISFFSSQTNLRLGNNKIETYRRNFTPFVVKLPTLHLNPLSGNVTIGPTDGDYAALTIRSYDETKTGIDIQVDLSLEGHGRIGAQGSVYIQLDDNGNANEYFSIKDSDWGDIFYVGENGEHYMKGNLQVDGNITATGTIALEEEFKVFTSYNFVDNFDDLESDIYGTSGESSDAAMRGRLELPHNSTITKIEIIYIDNSPYDIDFKIFSFPLESSSAITDFEWDSSGDDSNYRTATISNLNINIDNENRLYAMEIESQEWGSGSQHVKFRALKVYFTR